MKICEKRSLESQTIEFLRFPLAVMVIFIHSTRKPIPLNLDLLHENPLCIETFYNLCRVLLSDVVPAMFMLEKDSSDIGISSIPFI